MPAFGQPQAQDDELARVMALSRQTAQQEDQYRQTGQMPANAAIGNASLEEENLQRVLQESMQTKSTMDRNYEPIARVDQRIRERD